MWSGMEARSRERPGIGFRRRRSAAEYICRGDRVTMRHQRRAYVCAMVLGASLAAAAGLRDEGPAAGSGDRGLVERAEAALAAGRLEEAEHLLGEHLRRFPGDTEARVWLARCAHRRGDFSRARDIFSEVLRERPGDLDALVGLGYATLQAEGPGPARAVFEQVLAADDSNRDALRGLLLCGLRPDSSADLVRRATEAGRRLVRLDPSDRASALSVVALEVASGGPGELRPRAPEDPSKPLAVPYRAGRDYLEVADGKRYRAIFVKGINLGAALPGRYPSEFPEDPRTYAGWLETISRLGANAVRVYTLHPPAFYRALAAHNASPGARRLWLLQGVWAELPPGHHDFSDPAYTGQLESEVARVVDAVHGNLVLGARPGRASGSYDADVSADVLAFIIGREWEPFAVLDYNALRPGETSWSGRWFRVEGARAMECWIGRILDFAAGYEARRYRAIRPVAFASWPTLDPLHHPTEATRAEEDAWRERYGIPHERKLASAPWEDDAVSLDATRVLPAPGNPAGTFAAYHIYPNYPDFLNLEPAYARARDRAGPFRYAGYLEALERHHGRQPVLVAEFGISTSRGIAHLEPGGAHHGGHDERAQGALLARMLRAIHEAGMAGGIVFELLDEWFKPTWSVAPLEVPAERRRLWFNAESPEQSYGLIAARPARAAIRVDGDPADWSALPALASAERPAGVGWAALRELRATSDEGYLYLLLATWAGAAPPDWSRVSFRLALDTYAPERGERELPAPGRAAVPTGVEFLVELGGPDASYVAASEPYDPYRKEPPGRVASPREPTGRFARLHFETNRERFGRDGTRYPALTVERGALRFGSLDPASPAFDTRTDVAIGEASGTIELRLPWSLLNVADPSSRRVLDHESAEAGTEAGTVETDGIRIYAFSVDPSDPESAPLDRLPPAGTPARPYVWQGWEEPSYVLEPKLGLDELRRAMEGIRGPLRRPAAGAEGGGG